MVRPAAILEGVIAIFFDTHAHYDDERFALDCDELLENMNAAGVDLIVNAGCDVQRSARCLAIADKYDFVYGAAGVHPHDTDAMNDDTERELRELLRHPKCVALGEIGLDFHYDYSPRDIQALRFRQQLEIARDLNLPVIIHEREAFKEAMNILDDFRGLSLVFHCFSEGIEEAKIVLDRGWLLSFTGVVTYKKNTAIDVAAYVPDDRIMIETDAPYLAPAPLRGKRNDSRYIKYTAEAIALARGMDLADFAEITMKNGLRFFGIS